jgi:DNA-binding NarL/FixJ family response regulator
MPAVSYLTRCSGIDVLIAAVYGAVRGERKFDPAIESRIVRTSQGWRLKQKQGLPSVSQLTNRELEVMRLLAQGQSVRDCASKLNLAESTIDNHKSRLMRKLHVHKAAELTHVAIRDGLITV